MSDRTLPFPVFDADNHLYEATDAFTRYLPPEYDGRARPCRPVLRERAEQRRTRARRPALA